MTKPLFLTTGIREPFHFQALYFLEDKSHRPKNCRYRFPIQQVCSGKNAPEEDEDRTAERDLTTFDCRLFVADCLQVYCRLLAGCLLVICSYSQYGWPDDRTRTDIGWNDGRNLSLHLISENSQFA